MAQKFKPAFGLKNRHIQTLYSSLFRKLPPLKFEIEKFTLNDDDFLECYWHNKPSTNSTKPIIILFHGLAGSFKSPYIQGLMSESAKKGFASVLMHFRGCSGVENLKPRSYHSGESSDALVWIEYLSIKYPNAKLFAVGYSLGGNMLLKLLGESKNKSLLNAAVSVSAPLQLDICANAMKRDFSKFYQHILLKNLNIALDKKYDSHNMELLLNFKRQNIQKLKTFWEFDETYTAPIHGFKSAQDYYTKCSSKQFLKNIQTPTLIIHSKDDPFMTQEIIPLQNELSSSVEVEISENGGHVGFIGGTFFKPDYWLEKRVVSYFLGFI